MLSYTAWTRACRSQNDWASHPESLTPYPIP
jgi:hypothetical protein